MASRPYPEPGRPDPSGPRPPETPPLDTVGHAAAIDRIVKLADRGKSTAFTLDIPAEACPPGLLVAKPQALAIRHGDGRFEVKPVADFLGGLLGKPPRRRGTATTTTLKSFCDLVKRNGDDASLLFLDANWKAPKITAVLNYHREAEHDDDVQPEAQAAGDDPLARFGDHRVLYAFPLSESWKAWIEKDGELMSPTDFARFLEDHIHELAVPDTDDDSQERSWEKKFRTRIADPNELVELARGLEVVVNARIKTKTRLASGETSLVFETEHSGPNGEEITVPGLFMIALPVFFRGAPQRVLVRLRYRPAGSNGVMWAFEIFRPDEVIDERVQDDVREIVHQTGHDVILGAPEMSA